MFNRWVGHETEGIPLTGYRPFRAVSRAHDDGRSRCRWWWRRSRPLVAFDTRNPAGQRLVDNPRADGYHFHSWTGSYRALRTSSLLKDAMPPNRMKTAGIP